MIDFFGMAGPFVIIFRGEGAGAFIKQTPFEVCRFLIEEETGVFCDRDARGELGKWITDPNYWHFDEDGEPFEWDMPFGEICSVSVVKITRDVPAVRIPPRSTPRHPFERHPTHVIRERIQGKVKP